MIFKLTRQVTVGGVLLDLTARNMVDNDVNTFSGTNDDIAYIYMLTHINVVS
jgi:hypothetical protein